VISAGTWVQALVPELPIQPVRKVFAWYQADGRYSVKNNFQPLPASCQMVINTTVSRQKTTS
jgi:hypothetical protein